MTKEKVIEACRAFYLGLGYQVLDARKRKATKKNMLIPGWEVELQSMEDKKAETFWTYCSAPGVNDDNYQSTE